ncbi:MAG TPA: sensor domain-containing protein [Micromonosporaceae bacterium]|jgi:hypothetical protein
MTNLYAEIGRRSFLRSWWPLRGIAYAGTTAVASAVLWAALSCLIAPFLLAGHLIGQERHALVAVPALVVGLVLVATCGPPLAAGVAHVERARLKLADDSVPPVRRTAANLYRDPATLREAGYLVMLALAPVWIGAIALAALLEVALIAAPFAMHLTGPFVIGTYHVHSLSAAVLLSIIGVLLVLPLAYVTAGLAGTHARVARALLA